MKSIWPRDPSAPAWVTNVCSVPEVFVTPAPLIVKANPGETVTVKALAPGLKIMLSSSISLDNATPEILESAKVATSLGPLGTVAGVQLAAVFQSLLIGFRFQVALSA